MLLSLAESDDRRAPEVIPLRGPFETSDIPTATLTVATAAALLLVASSPVPLTAQDAGVRVLPWSAAGAARTLAGEDWSPPLSAFMEDFRAATDFFLGDMTRRLDTLPTPPERTPRFTGWETQVTVDSTVRVRLGVAAVPDSTDGVRPGLCELARGMIALIEVGALRSRGKEAVQGISVALFEAPGGGVPDDAPLLARTLEGREIACAGRGCRWPTANGCAGRQAFGGSALSGPGADTPGPGTQPPRDRPGARRRARRRG